MNADTQNEVRKRIRSFFRQVNTLFFTFIAGIVLFLVSVLIVVYYNGPLDAKYTTFLYIFAPISAVSLLLLSYRLYTGRVKNAQDAESMHGKMEGYRGAVVLRMILLDGAAFIQLLAYVMTADKVFVILCVALTSLFMLYKPGLNAFIKDLQLNETETRVMRDHAV